MAQLAGSKDAENKRKDQELASLHSQMERLSQEQRTVLDRVEQLATTSASQQQMLNQSLSAESSANRIDLIPGNASSVIDGKYSEKKDEQKAPKPEEKKQIALPPSLSN